MASKPVHILDAALDLLVPAHCVGCDQPHTQLCPDCRNLLEGARPTPARPTAAPADLPEVFAATPYAGAVRQILLAHKERGALRLAHPLGTALAATVRCAVPPGAASRALPLLLVPMPSAPATVRARGHDPTLRLSRAAAAALRRAGVPARLLPALRQRRRVADQSGLSAADRLRNLRGALGVHPHRRHHLGRGRVILVDDLVTTGATLAEGARALSAAGGDVLVAAVVAATPRHADHPPSGRPAGPAQSAGPAGPDQPG
ncbi:ComF family protein [Streptacidiphilus sp. PB12-B1b]|uniref:ComF family protein n=1 Tax=Streptacidiphilus sp. PB12-B1b TaxID=2705012 RepID=UPI0015F994B9|nr:phosphoribosyltransferase family protein [Streptacidiphilus sp. PB12-B1b]